MADELREGGRKLAAHPGKNSSKRTGRPRTEEGAQGIHEWSFAERARPLVTTTPFHPSWREKEAEILGLPPRDVPAVIAWRPGAHLWGPQSVYPEELDRQITEMGERLRQRLQGGASPSEVEFDRYELLSVYRLSCEYGREMDRLIGAAVRGDGKRSGLGRPPPEDERLA